MRTWVGFEADPQSHVEKKLSLAAITIAIAIGLIRGERLVDRKTSVDRSAGYMEYNCSTRHQLGESDGSRGEEGNSRGVGAGDATQWAFKTFYR